MTTPSGRSRVRLRLPGTPVSGQRRTAAASTRALPDVRDVSAARGRLRAGHVGDLSLRAAGGSVDGGRVAGATVSVPGGSTRADEPSRTSALCRPRLPGTQLTVRQRAGGKQSAPGGGRTGAPWTASARLGVLSCGHRRTAPRKGPRHGDDDEEGEGRPPSCSPEAQPPRCGCPFSTAQHCPRDEPNALTDSLAGSPCRRAPDPRSGRPRR